MINFSEGLMITSTAKVHESEQWLQTKSPENKKRNATSIKVCSYITQIKSSLIDQEQQK